MGHISMLLLLFLGIYVPVSVNAADVPLPALPGPFSVGTLSLQAIDHTRQDPYAPTPQPRALMLSMFYPTSDTCHPFASYLPGNLAAFADLALGFPPGLLEKIRTQSIIDARLKKIPDIPIILFSPGLGSSREAYQIVLEGLASYGYFVVAMDHTYDAAVVQFPDGDLVIGLGINGDAQALDVRSKDCRFVIDQLGNDTFIKQVPGIVHRKLNNSRVAMFGHSLGGATALQAMEIDRRIKGGCNLDGPLSGTELTKGTNQPFLLIGAAGHTRFSDPAWAQTWKHLAGWKAELTLANSTHLTFSDYPAVFTTLGIIDELDPTRATYGSIDGIRSTVVEVAYLKGFFDFVLLGKHDSMFRHPDPKFPEITIV